MKKSAVIMALTLFSSVVLANISPPQLELDKISFNVTAKQWVSTKSALVNVNVNATMTNTDLVQARAQIMSRLNKIAKGEWHVVQFDRSQDNSGLEKLVVQAKARVDQSGLPDIYKQAKAVSQPGMNYKIESIEFQPSLEEVQHAKNKLRKILYTQANQELTRINKIYANQTYSLYNLAFIDGTSPNDKMYKSRESINTMAMSAVQPPLSVSNELIMTGLVQVASNRKQGG